MLQDPFQEREAEKYENPIPSREFILTYLNTRKKPASRKELLQELKISGINKTKALRKRLHAMERDGQLVFTRRHCYALPDPVDLLQGKVIGHRDGFGFLRIADNEDYKDDLYLSNEQMKICIHGDIVLAQAIRADKKGKFEARVIRVITPRNNQIVARYFIKSGVSFVIPDDNRLSFYIFIPSGELMGAQIGSIVVVELTQRPTRYNKATGKIIEVLGEHMNTNLVVDIALRTYDIPHKWSLALKEQIANLNEEISEQDKHGRIDLRNLPLITIDGEDTVDFDDALFCEHNQNDGWRLWVAISDVSYYVLPGTPLDDEAMNRGTSVYFPSKVLPMLPEILSNGLCSLNPNVDRLCIVCEMIISSSGQLITYKHYEAIMNSAAKLTYNEVWSILQKKKKIGLSYNKDIVKNIEELNNMYLALYKAREHRGAISFEIEEAKFVFNKDYRIDRIETASRNHAHKIVEECMILANIASANYVENNKEPSLFRDHERPTDKAVKNFRAVLNKLGLKLSGGNKPQSKDYANLLRLIIGRPDQEMLQTMLLRSMKQAIYDPKNRGHFGLALASYTHFTSPIRRYPDLLLHRSIKYLLGKNHLNYKKIYAIKRGSFHYELQQLNQYAQHCSMTERRADEATRDVLDWLKCDFMENRVGEVFKGVITSITYFGFFVRLSNLFIDGLVHISTLKNDYYRFDAIEQQLIGESSGYIYHIGDIVKVLLHSVNIEERKIEFLLVAKHQKNE